MEVAEVLDQQDLVEVLQMEDLEFLAAYLEIVCFTQQVEVEALMMEVVLE